MPRYLTYVAVALLASSCGGGGGADGAPPTAEIHFPPPVSLTDGLTVTLRGVAADASTIASVTVNGVAAATSDGFASWSAGGIPLAPGANTLTVDVVDEHGNQDAAAATVVVTRDPDATTTGTIGAGPALDGPVDVAIDPVNDRLLLIDTTRSVLLAIDWATGDRAVVSSPTVGAGPPSIARPVGLALDVPTQRAFVADSLLDLLIEVDLTTGDRRTITDSAVGGIPGFPAPQGVAYDAAVDRWFMCETASELIIEVDATGARRRLSGGGVGSGPGFDLPRRIVHDPAHDRLLVINRAVASQFLAVDLANGNRTVIADDLTGTGFPASLGFPAGLAHDVAHDRVFMQIVESDTTAAVELATGDRSVISDDATGVGPAFEIQTSLAFDADRNVVVVIDSDLDAVLVVDVVSGDRVILTR